MKLKGLIAPFAESLLKWYAEHGRKLPWRGISDPYAIWVSEVILQQTRIEQGRDYWLRFMQRFPTVEALASASEDEVLLAWEGLGYYNRARNMHLAAQQIVELGHFPNTYAELKKLKGVGDYTAAAVASIAFGEPVATVDGNVYRVLTRYYGSDTPIDSSFGKKIFRGFADMLLPADYPAEFNQAMMDLGATVCTPRGARCDECPLTDTCMARREGTVDKLPVKMKTDKNVQTLHFTYIVLNRGEVTALRRRPAPGIWQGLWEPLLIEGENPELPELGCELQPVAQGVRHLLTHRIIMIDCYLAQPVGEWPFQLPDDYYWVFNEDLDYYAMPRPVKRFFSMIKPQLG